MGSAQACCLVLVVAALLQLTCLALQHCDAPTGTCVLLNPHTYLLYIEAMLDEVGWSKDRPSPGADPNQVGL